MGTQFIDYIIADQVVAPFEHQQFYTEKIVHLPDCFQVNDSKRKIAENAPTRQKMGLPEHAFVFCRFNAVWKITPAIFDTWMQLLHRVEGSMLWLVGENESAERNLRKEAQQRGIDPSRLVCGTVPFDEYLARDCLADLFLDTLRRPQIKQGCLATNFICSRSRIRRSSEWAGPLVLTPSLVEDLVDTDPFR